MMKTSIGELKLSPLKENGKFVFFNDFVTINGKVSKGDRISIYVAGYDLVNDAYNIKEADTAYAVLTVRGQEFTHDNKEGFITVNDLYKQASEWYKSHFYFGNKVQQ